MLLYLAMIESEADRTKFEKIYYAYRGLMFYVAQGILRDERDSEDVVHDAFVNIISNLERIEKPESQVTKALVVIIVRHKAIDLYRSRQKGPFLFLKEEIREKNSWDHTEQLDQKQIVARALASLSARHRDVLLLRYSCGFPEAEVAELLSMTLANTHKTLQRAKKKLAEALEKEGYKYDDYG